MKHQNQHLFNVQFKVPTRLTNEQIFFMASGHAMDAPKVKYLASSWLMEAHKTPERLAELKV